MGKTLQVPKDGTSDDYYSPKKSFDSIGVYDKYDPTSNISCQSSVKKATIRGRDERPYILQQSPPSTAKNREEPSNLNTEVNDRIKSIEEEQSKPDKLLEKEEENLKNILYGGDIDIGSSSSFDSHSSSSFGE